MFVAITPNGSTCLPFRLAVLHAVCLGVALHKPHQAFPVIFAIDLQLALHSLEVIAFLAAENELHRRWLDADRAFAVGEPDRVGKSLSVAVEAIDRPQSIKSKQHNSHARCPIASEANTAEIFGQPFKKFDRGDYGCHKTR